MTDYKPKMRREFEFELRSAIEGVIRKSFENGDKLYPFRTCLNCVAFDEPKEICNKYNVRPPLRIMVFGCSMHEDLQEDVPF